MLRFFDRIRGRDPAWYPPPGFFGVSGMIGRPVRFVMGIAVLATSWRLFLFFDHSFWTRLTQGTANDADTAWLVFVIALYVSMWPGVLLARTGGVRRFFFILGSVAVLFPFFLYAFPILQRFFIAYGAFGLISGLYYSSVMVDASTEVTPEVRIRVVSIVVCGFTILVYTFLIAGRHTGFIPLLGAVQAVLLVSVMMKRFGTHVPRRRPVTKPDAPFPTAFLIATSLTVFVGYFINYFNRSGTGSQDFGLENPETAWLGFAVRMAVCLLFIVLGRRIRIVHSLYFGQGCIALAFVLSMMGRYTGPLAWVLYNVSNIVGSIVVYSLLSAIIAKYADRLGFASLLILSPGLGIVLGYLCGTWASRVLENYAIMEYAVPLSVLCGSFFALPFIIRSVTREVDLDRENTPGFLGGLASLSPEVQKGSESDVIAFRNLIGDSITAINASVDREYRLTTREREVARFLAERYDYETIAEKLFISVNTLKVHVKNIYRKLDVTGRKDLIGLIQDNLRKISAG